MSRVRVILIALGALAAAGGGIYLARHQDMAASLPVPDILTAERPAPAASSALSGGEVVAAAPFTNISDVVERVTPAVVNVQVKSQSDPAESLPPLFQDPRFRRFFGIPEQRPPQLRSSIGSGVIVNADEGYVLTNFHVVDDATEITVTLKDRRSFPATVVGRDEQTDLALLKIDAKDLVALPIGDMSQMRVGDYVLAVGNPFGLGQTVTSGIISAMGRAGFIDQGYEDFIQTDAAINPGNSGGALVNLKGELIGTPTVITTPSGGNVGIGFAVPVTIAANVMEQLIQYGEVSRGRIGVAIQDITAALAQNLGLDVNRGALVTNVQPGTAAEDAGIAAGDVIVAMNGEAVEGSANLRNRVGLTKPGETIKLSIIRGGKPREIDLTVGKVEPAQQTAALPEPAAPSQTMGAVFENVPGGVRVRDVQENSPAAALGLQDGDIITSVNRTQIRNASQVEKALMEAKSQSVVFLKRENREQVLVVP